MTGNDIPKKYLIKQAAQVFFFVFGKFEGFGQTSVD